MKDALQEDKDKGADQGDVFAPKRKLESVHEKKNPI